MILNLLDLLVVIKLGSLISSRSQLLVLNITLETLCIKAGSTLSIFMLENFILKMVGSDLQGMSYFKMLGLSFSSKFDWVKILLRKLQP